MGLSQQTPGASAGESANHTGTCKIVYLYLYIYGNYLQGHRFSAANLATFRGVVCEIPQNSATLLSQIPYIPRPVGVVVLTDNTSKYKEFIVTSIIKTHYIGPLLMKILSQCQTSCGARHNKPRPLLPPTEWYWLVNGLIFEIPILGYFGACGYFWAI